MKRSRPSEPGAGTGTASKQTRLASITPEQETRLKRMYITDAKLIGHNFTEKSAIRNKLLTRLFVSSRTDENTKFVGNELRTFDRDYPLAKRFLDIEDTEAKIYRLEKKLNLESYTGDIGFVKMGSGPTYLLMDPTAMLTDSKDQIVSGLANFSNVKITTDAQTEEGKINRYMEANLEIIAIHPAYRSIGDMGCILLSSAEESLMKLAKSYRADELRILIPYAIFLGISDDSVYQFYYRNGYRPLGMQMGNIIMEKIIHNHVEESPIEKLDQQCIGRMINFETKQYPDAVTQLEDIILRPTLIRIGEHTITPDLNRKMTIPYKRARRSESALDKRLKRLEMLLLLSLPDAEESRVLIANEMKNVKDAMQDIHIHPDKFEEEYKKIIQDAEEDNKRVDEEERKYLLELHV
jgi:hypothetical protein